VLPAAGAERCECKMKKRIIAGILVILAILSLVSCSKGKDSEKGNGDDLKEDVPPDSGETKYNFLVLGHDRAANLTDVIILISYDIKQQTISMLQIPRDTYVELDDYSYHKINGAYNYYMTAARKNGSSNPEKDGCRGFASFLETNLCVKIHYCAVMDLDGFSGIVETIGEGKGINI